MKVGNLVRWRFAPDPLATHLVLSFHSGNKKSVMYSARMERLIVLMRNS